MIHRLTNCLGAALLIGGWAVTGPVGWTQSATDSDSSHDLNIHQMIDIEKPPINYSETEDDNRVTRLMAKLQSEQLELDYDSETGYLRSLLEALEVPESSQTLVFSKTSLQVQHISKRNPRAIYFNDDTYVGWVRGSSLMEISTTDPKLGAAFYTVDMMPWKADIERAYYDCLACHVTSMTRGVPGHTIRSVQPHVDGSIDAQRQSFITDHTSPFSERWGGWYVTGRHGDMQHMGNATLVGGRLQTNSNGNRLSLRGEFDSFSYLSPYSDIVALMVMEHQTQLHNIMTRADFAVRHANYERSQQQASEESDQEYQFKLHALSQEIVDGLLFVGETPLPSEVKGLLSFQSDFQQRGPDDSEGRSLRQFDLNDRLFKYPCSYLIYTSAFENLAPELRDQVVSDLLDVLQGNVQSSKYQHLTPELRDAILAILRDTKPDWFAEDPPETAVSVHTPTRRQSEPAGR